MDSPTYSPENTEERLIYWAIVGTWGFYVLGALYLLAPALGWILTGLVFWRWHFKEAAPHQTKFPVSTVIWCLGMLMMLVALVAAHIMWTLGTPQLIKSSIGWAKGWALLALFILAGSALKIRMHMVARAVNILALQTLILLPLFLLAPVLNLPSRLYISPLLMLGGPGPEFFEVQLYGAGPDGGGARWRFFSPWAPAAGMVANVSLVISMLDKSWGWKAIGIAAAVAACLLSQSRLALIVLIVVPLVVWGLGRLTRPLLLLVGGIAAATAGILATTLLDLIEQGQARFTSARAASSRVRAALGRIAVQRWEAEAPWFGHGIVERGPHLVEYMPIGSHHTWFGLLYVKGIVGFAALAIPMLYSFIETVLKAQSSRIGRAALAIILIIFLYTFGENLEILVYLFWPGLLVIGKAAGQRFRSPFRHYLAGHAGSEE